MNKISIDGSEIDLTKASTEVKRLVDNIQFVNAQILQRNNELQISETAWIGYERALKRELAKVKIDAES